MSNEYMYDTSFYSIKRAEPRDLPQIIDLIISEPYFRWFELFKILFSNIYITITWFIGALCTMIMAMMYLYLSKKESNYEYKSRIFYIILGILTGIIIFLGCYSYGLSLYFLRYISAFEIKKELKKLNKKELNDNILILKNKKINLFWKIYNFYIAQPFDQNSKKLILGLISLTSYIDYCKERHIKDKDFQVIVKAVPDGFKLISHKTIVISWFIINEKFFKNTKINTKTQNNRLRNSIYNGLLKYIDNNIIKDTSINYLIVESDDFLYWQHDILINNKFGFCGERIDLKWYFYFNITKEGYPNHKYFFIKVCNIDEKAFKKALKREQEKEKQKQKQNKNKSALI